MIKFKNKLYKGFYVLVIPSEHRRLLSVFLNLKGVKSLYIFSVKDRLVLEITDEQSKADFFYRIDDNGIIIEDPEYFCGLAEEGTLIVGSKILLRSGYDGLHKFEASGPESEELGPENLILSVVDVQGSYFLNGLVSGFVEIKGLNRVKTNNAFSRQVGGYIDFKSLSGNFIARERYGGMLKGGKVSGSHFELDKKGGVTVASSVESPYAWKNMDGGLVIVDRHKGEKSFENMTAGIAIVGKFDNGNNSAVGDHDGGTIITSDESLKGIESLSDDLFEQALVFSGENSLRKLKSFSSYLCNLTNAWVTENSNMALYNSVLDLVYSDSNDKLDTAFKGILNGLITKNNKKGYETLQKVETNRKKLYKRKPLDLFLTFKRTGLFELNDMTNEEIFYEIFDIKP